MAREESTRSSAGVFIQRKISDKAVFVFLYRFHPIGLNLFCRSRTIPEADFREQPFVIFILGEVIVPGGHYFTAPAPSADCFRIARMRQQVPELTHVHAHRNYLRRNQLPINPKLELRLGGPVPTANAVNVVP